MGVAIVVGLQAGEDEVEFLVFDSGGEGAGGVEGVEADKGIVLEVDGAVGAFGQRFPQDLTGASRAGGDHDHFAGMLFFLAQGLFESVGVGFIDLVGKIFADPGP